MNGVFVTGTGTEVGKTVIASALAATLAARGERVAVFKPVVTGLDERGELPPDHELLRRSAGSGQQPDAVAPYRFGPPVSPHLAAVFAGTRLDPRRLLEQAGLAARGGRFLVTEGVGGLMVPLTANYLVRDFAADLALPMIVVGQPGLGTINHTLLTVEAARACGLELVGVVLTPWPARPSEMELSNRDTLARLTGLPVHAVPRLKISAAGVAPLGDVLAEDLLEPARHGARRLAA
jgi:dethiobiotin synthetase